MFLALVYVKQVMNKCKKQPIIHEFFKIYYFVYLLSLYKYVFYKQVFTLIIFFRNLFFYS